MSGQNQITGWFSEYSRRILRYIRSRINDLEDAEDAAQDVWLQLTRQQDPGAIEHIGNWLFTAARNRVTDYYRKKKNIPFSHLAASFAEPDPDGEDDASSDLSFAMWAGDHVPDEVLEAAEFWEMLEAALEELPDEQRQVFVANELYGLPFKDIAAETDVPLNTLLSRKRYAVLHLRKYFEKLN